MSDEQTNCARCGVRILVVTAQERAGLCMPCSRGERERIEEGRRWNLEQKAFRASPIWVFWERLVRSDFSSLTREEQLYYAVNCLRGEVTNGGLHQYFFNSSGLLYGVTEEGLTVLRAEQTLAIIQEAKQALFGQEEITLDAQERKFRWSLDDKDVCATLDELDKRFYGDPDDLWELLQDFGIACGFYPQRWSSF